MFIWERREDNERVVESYADRSESQRESTFVFPSNKTLTSMFLPFPRRTVFLFLFFNQPFLLFIILILYLLLFLFNSVVWYRKGLDGPCGSILGRKPVGPMGTDKKIKCSWDRWRLTVGRCFFFPAWHFFTPSLSTFRFRLKDSEQKRRGLTNNASHNSFTVHISSSFTLFISQIRTYLFGFS